MDIYEYFKPKFNVSFLTIGLAGLIFGINAHLHGIAELNSYTLMGLVMIVYFIFDVHEFDRMNLSYGLWFSLLASQVVYVMTTGRNELSFVAALFLVNVFYQLLDSGKVIGALILIGIAIVIPFQFGEIILSIAVLFYVFKQMKEGEMPGWIAVWIVIYLTLMVRQSISLELSTCFLPVFALSDYHHTHDVRTGVTEVAFAMLIPQSMVLCMIYLALNFSV